MDLNAIPKTFWHSISLAILVTTFGLVLIAYRSGEVSIDFASKTVQISNAQADLYNTLDKVKVAAAELQTRNDLLEQQKEELEKRVSELESQAKALASRPNSSRDTAEFNKALADLRHQTRVQKTPATSSRPPLDDTLKDAQLSLDRVRLQVQQIQPVTR